MLFQQLNRSDPEKVFVIGRSEVGATVVDQLVCWDLTGITANHIVTASTGTLGLVAGVLPAAIASSAYGLVQAYGYYPTALISIHASSSTDAVAGCPLFPKDTQLGWDYAAAADTLDDGVDQSFAVVLEAVTFVTTVTTVQAKIFIRCL